MPAINVSSFGQREEKESLFFFFFFFFLKISRSFKFYEVDRSMSSGGYLFHLGSSSYNGGASLVKRWYGVLQSVDCNEWKTEDRSNLFFDFVYIWWIIGIESQWRNFTMSFEWGIGYHLLFSDLLFFVSMMHETILNVDDNWKVENRANPFFLSIWKWKILYRIGYHEFFFSSYQRCAIGELFPIISRG